MSPSAADNTRPNGMSSNGVHTNGTTATNGPVPDDYDVRVPLNDEYAFKPRKLKVITIGAGFSGLLMAHKFQHRFPEMQEYVEHMVFERHDDIGGTVSSMSHEYSKGC